MSSLGLTGPLDADKPSDTSTETLSTWPGEEETVRINLSVPKSMRIRWKVAALQADNPLGDVIIAAMEAYLPQVQSGQAAYDRAMLKLEADVTAAVEAQHAERPAA